MTNLAPRTFRIPYEFHERYDAIRDYLRKQARQNAVTMSQLADAMLYYAREAYDNLRLELPASCLSRQAKNMSETSECAAPLPRPADAPLKNATYRISNDNHDLLLYLCRKDFLLLFGYAKGEALILLFEYVIAALNEGRARITPGDPILIEAIESHPEKENPKNGNN